MVKFYLCVALAVSSGFAYGASDMTIWDFIKGLYNQTVGEELLRDKIDRKKDKSPHWTKVSIKAKTWGKGFFWGLTDEGLQHVQEHGLPKDRDFYLRSIVLFQGRYSIDYSGDEVDYYGEGVNQVGLARINSVSSQYLAMRAPDLFPKTHESPDYSIVGASSVRAIALATPSIMGMVQFHKDDIEHLHVHREMDKIRPVPDTWSDYLWGTVVVGFSDGSFLVRLGGMLDSKPVNGEPLMPKPLPDLPNWGREEGEKAALAIVSGDKIL